MSELREARPMDSEDLKDLRESLSPEDRERLDNLNAEKREELMKEIERRRAGAESQESVDDRMQDARETALARAKSRWGSAEIKDMREVRDVRNIRDLDEGNNNDFWHKVFYPVTRPIQIGGHAVAKGLSGLFKAIEQAGTDMIKKNAPYVKWVPWVGPWLLKKAEKSIAEREAEEEKKRAKSKKAKKKEKKDLDALVKAGFTEKQAKAVLKAKEAEEKKKEEGKKDDAEKGEEKKAA